MIAARKADDEGEGKASTKRRGKRKKGNGAGGTNDLIDKAIDQRRGRTSRRLSRVCARLLTRRSRT